jgi:lysophospholipase L1-like esterase
MAHLSPKADQAKRRMAHPVRRGPLGAVLSAVGNRLPHSAGSGSAEYAPGRYYRRSAPVRRQRDLAVMVGLLIVGTAVSVTLVGGWFGGSSAAPTGRLGANASPSSPSSFLAGSASPLVSTPRSPAPSSSVAPTAKPTPKPTPVSTTSAPPPDKTYVTLGDSLTAWPPAGPWPARLDAEDTRLRLVHNAGVPGNLTSQMLGRVNKDVFAYNPNVLFILGGTNDAGRSVPLSTTIANLRAIINAARARNIRIFMITVPPSSADMAKRIDAMNAAITHLANSYRIVVINIHDVLSQANGAYVPKYTSDGVHFSDLGVQLVANTIYRRIHRLGF